MTTTADNKNSSVVMVRDPSKLFDPGATFNLYDLGFGVIEGSWAQGTVFDVDGHVVKLIGSVPVRDDGAFLHCQPGNFVWKPMGGQP